MTEFEHQHEDDDDVHMETSESHRTQMLCADCGHTWFPQYVVEHESDPATGETPAGGHRGDTMHALHRSEVRTCPECGSGNIEAT